MPILGGRKTAKEKVFAERYAMTGDRRYAAEKAGYAQPDAGASQALKRPEIQAEVRAIQVKRMEGLLEVAINVLTDVLTTGTERGKLMAVKIVVDKTLGLAGSAVDAKEAHEMTADEIDAKLAQLRGEMEARANRAKDVTPAPKGDVFE